MKRVLFTGFKPFLRDPIGLQVFSLVLSDTQAFSFYEFDLHNRVVICKQVCCRIENVVCGSQRADGVPAQWKSYERLRSNFFKNVFLLN